MILPARTLYRRAVLVFLAGDEIEEVEGVGHLQCVKGEGEGGWGKGNRIPFD